MSADPNQIAQLIAMYRQQFPGGPAQAQAYQQAQMPAQAVLGMGNAPPGTNTGAGATNAIAKLLMALMARKKMQDYNKQYPQQGTTATAPASPPATSGQDTGGDASAQMAMTP